MLCGTDVVFMRVCAHLHVYHDSHIKIVNDNSDNIFYVLFIVHIEKNQLEGHIYNESIFTIR